MRVVVTSLAVALLAGCPSDPIDCRDLGRVEGPADNCVCPEPLVPVPADHPDYPGCECPAGTIPSGDTCVLPDGGPDDAETDAGPRPEEDGCVPVTLHRDADGDGRGDPDVTTTACPGLAGHVENADDCDDACAVCWEGATETCDESDNDCDGFVDEGVREVVGEPTAITSEQSVRTQFTSYNFDLAPLDSTRYAVLFDSTNDTGLALAVLDEPTRRLVGEPVLVGSTDLTFFPTLLVTSGRVLVFWTGVRSVFGRAFSSDTLAPVGDVVELARDTSSTGIAPGSTSAVAFGGGAAVAWVGRDNVARVRSVPANLVALLDTTLTVADTVTALAATADDEDVVIALVRRSGADAEIVTRRLALDGSLSAAVTTPAPGAETVDIARTAEGELMVAWTARTEVSNPDSPVNTLLGVVSPAGVVETFRTITPARATFIPRLSVVDREAYVGTWHISATGYPASLARIDGPRVDLAPITLIGSPAVTASGLVVFVDGDIATGVEGDLVFRELGCAP